MIRPYPKYGYWYIPGCNIQFESDDAAMEYIREYY